MVKTQETSPPAGKKGPRCIPSIATRMGTSIPSPGGFASCGDTFDAFYPGADEELWFFLPEKVLFLPVFNDSRRNALWEELPEEKNSYMY